MNKHLIQSKIYDVRSSVSLLEAAKSGAQGVMQMGEDGKPVAINASAQGMDEQIAMQQTRAEYLEGLLLLEGTDELVQLARDTLKVYADKPSQALRLELDLIAFGLNLQNGLYELLMRLEA